MTLLLIGGYLLGWVVTFTLYAKYQNSKDEPWTFDGSQITPTGAFVAGFFCWWLALLGSLLVLLWSEFSQWFDELIKNGGKK